MKLTGAHPVFFLSGSGNWVWGAKRRKGKRRRAKRRGTRGREADYAMGPRFMGFFVALGDHPKRTSTYVKRWLGCPKSRHSVKA